MGMQAAKTLIVLDIWNDHTLIAVCMRGRGWITRLLLLCRMAALRGQWGALSNDRSLRRFVVQATPTGRHLGTGSYGAVEEVR